MKLFSTRPTPRQIDVALLAVRIIAGIIFVAHGWQKFEMGVSGVAGFFGQTGAPFPTLTAPLVTYLELLGGGLLALGFLTRPLAFLFAIDMLSATLLVHAKNGLSGPGGMEFTLLLASVAFALLVAGPGGLSADRRLDKSRAPAEGRG